MGCRKKRPVTRFITSLFPVYLRDKAVTMKYPREKQTLGACAVVAVAKRLCFSRVAPVPGDSIRVLFPNKRHLLKGVRRAPTTVRRHISPQQVFLEIKATIMAIGIVICLHQHSYSFKGDVLIIKNCTVTAERLKSPLKQDGSLPVTSALSSISTPHSYRLIFLA